MHEANRKPGEALLAAGIAPSPPGDFLTEWVLSPLDLRPDDVAAKIGVDAATLGEVLANLRPIDVSLAEKLGGLTGTSHRLWLNVQAAFDLAREATHSGVGVTSSERSSSPSSPSSTADSNTTRPARRTFKA